MIALWLVCFCSGDWHRHREGASNTVLSLSCVPLAASLLGVPVSTNPPGCSPSDLRCRPMPVCHQGPSVATWATWATWTSHSLPQGAPQGISAVQTGRTSWRGIWGKPFSSAYCTNTLFFKTPTPHRCPLSLRPLPWPLPRVWHTALGVNSVS